MNLIKRILTAFAFLALINTTHVVADTIASLDTLVARNASAEEIYNAGYQQFEADAMSGDQSLARSYFTVAAEAGYRDAQKMLGDMYGFGIGGTPSSYEVAAKWYEMAAKQGDAKSQLYMGDLYSYGLGVEMNLDKAIYYMTLALENPESDAESRSLAAKRREKFKAQQ